MPAEAQNIDISNHFKGMPTKVRIKLENGMDIIEIIIVLINTIL